MVMSSYLIPMLCGLRIRLSTLLFPSPKRRSRVTCLEADVTGMLALGEQSFPQSGPSPTKPLWAADLAWIYCSKDMALKTQGRGSVAGCSCFRQFGTGNVELINSNCLFYIKSQQLMGWLVNYYRFLCCFQIICLKRSLKCPDLMSIGKMSCKERREKTLSKIIP